MEAYKVSHKERSLVWLARFWIVAAITFSVWETLNYSGIAAFLGEWQYDKIGAAYPALNCLLIIAGLSSPLLMIARLQRRDHKEHVDSEIAQYQSTYRAAARLRNGFQIAMLITACVIIVIAVFTGLLPSDGGPVNVVTVTDAPTPPQLGNTELHGKVLYDKIAVFNESTPFSHSSDRFVPIVGEGGNQERLRYFVELPSDMRQLSTSQQSYRGVLRGGGLPGDLEKVYRYAGYNIPDDYFVLFYSKQSMSKRYIQYMIELSALFGFFTIMQMVFWYRTRRIKKVIAQIS